MRTKHWTQTPQTGSLLTNASTIWNTYGAKPRKHSDMRIQNDFREFLRLLKAHDVDFVILGGYAVAFHGYVRNTQDLDIFFRSDDRGVSGKYHDIPVAYIGRAELIRNKRASGRPKDLADLAELSAVTPTTHRRRRK